jgi:hypothetical protein
MNSEAAKRMRDQLRLHLARDVKPTHFLTFNFGWKANFKDADKKMAAFFNALQRKIYGRDWAARKAPSWPTAYGFLEHPHSNPHFHVLARLDHSIGLSVGDLGPLLWLKLVRSGQLDVQVIDKPFGVICYCTKRYMSDDAYSAMFVYSDTRKALPQEVHD